MSSSSSDSIKEENLISDEMSSLLEQTVEGSSEEFGKEENENDELRAEAEDGVDKDDDELNLQTQYSDSDVSSEKRKQAEENEQIIFEALTPLDDKQRPTPRKSLLNTDKAPFNKDGPTSTTSISLDELRRFFHLPIAEVAKHFGTCTTALKKICRKLNISKWPYRQILSLTKSIQSLEMASLNDNLEENLKGQYREQIQVLQKAIGEVMKNPNKAIDALNLSMLAGANLGGDFDNDDDEGEQPAVDVQHIIKAAAASIAQPERGGNALKKKLKRKSGDGELFEDDNLDDSQDDEPFSKKMKPLSSPVDITGGKASPDHIVAQQTPILLPEVGSTIVHHNPRYDNQKFQFIGPVQLAPLQRKRLGTATNRKVVPLMEPDIGSNYSIEFIPQLIVSMLHKSIADRSNVDADGHPTVLPSIPSSSSSVAYPLSSFPSR